MKMRLDALGSVVNPVIGVSADVRRRAVHAPIVSIDGSTWVHAC